MTLARDPHDEGDRAVASLVGYLLVFAVVIGGTVLVATAGLGVLADASDQQGERAVREVSRLASGVAAVVDGAPHREVRVRPRDAALEPGPNVTVNLTASGGGVDLTGGDAVVVTAETLGYDFEGGTVTYGAGLVASDQPDGADALARSPPDLRVSADRLVAVLPATTVTGSDRIAAGQGGRVPVVVEGGPARVHRRVATTPAGNATNLTGTVRVRGPAVGAWRDLFAERSGFAPADLDGDGDGEYGVDTDGDGRPEVAGASFETHRLYVRTVAVGVALGESL